MQKLQFFFIFIILALLHSRCEMFQNLEEDYYQKGINDATFHRNNPNGEPWKIRAYKSDMSLGFSSVNENYQTDITIGQDCNLDDYIYFKNNQTCWIDFGISKCENQPQITDTSRFQHKNEFGYDYLNFSYKLFLEYDKHYIQDFAQEYSLDYNELINEINEIPFPASTDAIIVYGFSKCKVDLYISAILNINGLEVNFSVFGEIEMEK